MPLIKILFLIALVATGLLLQRTGVIDFGELLELARQYADRGWLIAVLIAVQTALFTFAMAGSSMIWITALLFHPVTAALMITTGTTLGAVAAYYFSAHLSDDWARKVQDSRVVRLLTKEGGFFNLLALRLMPGFPHSIINYSAGFLHLRLPVFIAATIAGSAIKAVLYSVLIYRATTPEAPGRGIDFANVWPLFAFSLLVLLVPLLKRYRSRRKID